MANKSCLLQDKAQLLSPAKKKKHQLSSQGLTQERAPSQQLHASLVPPAQEGFGGRGEGGNACPSSEPSTGGAEAGMSEFGEGRTSPSRAMPSLEGAERGLVQLLRSWSDSPSPARPSPATSGDLKARIPPQHRPKTATGARMGQRRSRRPLVLWGKRNE